MKDKLDPKKLGDLTSEEYKIFASLPRFTIMLILHSNKKAKITDLAKTLNLTSGNLEHHIKILEEHKMIERRMQLFKKRVYTGVQITTKGKMTFSDYLILLKEIID